MGFVSNMVYCLYSQTTPNTQAYVPGVMHVYKWIGPVALLNSVYVPFIYYLNIDCDEGKHFCLEKLVLDDTNNSVVFVNQISGVTPSGFNIDPLCCNPTDSMLPQWARSVAG